MILPAPHWNEFFMTQSNIQTINAAIATANLPIFRVVGRIILKQLYGIITTTLSANHTAASFRLNDQLATVQLSAIGGSTLSGFTDNSIIMRTGTDSRVLVAANAGTNPPVGSISLVDITSQTHLSVITAKTGANTDIEYRYSTTDNPATGAMQFYIIWRPLTPTSTVSII